MFVMSRELMGHDNQYALNHQVALDFASVSNLDPEMPEQFGLTIQLCWTLNLICLHNLHAFYVTDTSQNSPAKCFSRPTGHRKVLPVHGTALVRRVRRIVPKPPWPKKLLNSSSSSSKSSVVGDVVGVLIPGNLETRPSNGQQTDRISPKKADDDLTLQDAFFCDQDGQPHVHHNAPDRNLHPPQTHGDKALAIMIVSSNSPGDIALTCQHGQADPAQ